jgi:hypothetical protein
MKAKMDEIVKKLHELNDVIKSLDPSIRQQSFDLLRPLFFGTQSEEDDSTPFGKPQGSHNNGQSTQSKEVFFKSFDNKKPSDNVFLIVAWLYSQHGAISIPSDSIKAVAEDTGLIVPERPDMTLRKAQKQGKHLFTKKGSGYMPTVHGEKFLKKTYNVKKGNLPFTPETED